jgi:hypothetical protein
MMAAWVMAIVCVAVLLFLGMFVWDRFDANKRTAKKKEQSRIDEVREAAFAVVEASLQAEPEKWGAILHQKTVDWLVNREAKIAIYLGGGTYGVHILDQRRFNNGYPLYTNDKDFRFEPNQEMRNRLFKAAMAIASGSAEKIETAQLENLVSAFGAVIHREKNNDKAAA